MLNAFWLHPLANGVSSWPSPLLTWDCSQMPIDSRTDRAWSFVVLFEHLQDRVQRYRRCLRQPRHLPGPRLEDESQATSQDTRSTAFRAALRARWRLAVKLGRNANVLPYKIHPEAVLGYDARNRCRNGTFERHLQGGSGSESGSGVLVGQTSPPAQEDLDTARRVKRRAFQRCHYCT